MRNFSVQGQSAGSTDGCPLHDWCSVESGPSQAIINKEHSVEHPASKVMIGFQNKAC